MNAHTKLSSKGQIVIPLDVRKQMKLSAGAAFDVIRKADDILLRRNRKKEGIPLQEAMDRLAAISKAFRPQAPFTNEQISAVAEEDLRAHYSKKYL
jgi:AbrB family looped-hinge helix DNA binding protein